MNFDERKAEILRRGEAKIAARKRKKRIILGTVIPVALVAVLALPFSQLSGRSKKEASLTMEGLPHFTQAVAEMCPELLETNNALANDKVCETAPEIDPEFSYTGADGKYNTLPLCTTSGELYAEPARPLEDNFPSEPPAITVTTADGNTVSPMIVGQCWLTLVDGKIMHRISKDLNVLYPGVVNVTITTQGQTLTLDTRTLPPSEVRVECWPTSQITKDFQYASSASQGVTVTRLPQQEDSSLPHDLFEIQLKPGSYVYRVYIEWSCGSASYAWIATAE